MRSSSSIAGLLLCSVLTATVPIALSAPGLAQTSAPSTPTARLNQQALDYYQQGQFQNALTTFQQVLELVRNSGNRSNEATTLTNIGMVYDSLQQYAQALEAYNQALTLRQALSDRRGEAEVLDGIGAIHSDQGQYGQAIRFHQQALTIWQALGDRSGELMTLNNLGFVYSRQGNYVQAQSHYERSLRLSRELSDRASEATALNNLGRVYVDQGQYPQALALYQEALAIRQALGDRSGLGTVLNNIGSLYDTLGQYPPALEYYGRSLELLRAAGDRRRLATTLGNIGLIYSNVGQLDQALDYHQQSLELRRQIGDRAGEGASLNNIGSIYSQQRQFERALEVYQQALVIARELGDRAAEGKIVGNLGVVYDSLNQTERALEYYKQSLDLLKATGDRAAQAKTLSNVGLLLAKQNQPELAIVFFKQSVNLTELIRQSIRTLPPEIQQTYTETVAEAYRRLADLLLQQDRALEAQQILDLLKLQELEEFLNDVQQPTASALVLPYWLPEQELIQLFDRAGTQGFAEFLNQPAVLEQINQLRRLARGQMLNPAHLDSLQDDLRQFPQPTALLYPLILDDRLELLVILPNGSPIRRRVQINREELVRAIAAFRSRLTNRAANPTAEAQQLYRSIIEPIAADLAQANIQTILYASDGPLRYVPLAALHDGQGWLIQRFRINHITAASIAQFNRSPQPNLRVLAAAFSDPQLSFSFEVGSRKFQFAGLPYAGDEVQNISTQIAGTTALLNQNFSRALVEPRMNNYSVVHLATHAEFVSGQPEDSFILFGNGDRITLRDVASWRLNNVDLMVLSGCRTAVGGELGNGEEILGFGYQMQRTGVRAAIASLWYVDDGGTQRLMNAFYAALRQGNTQAEALRQAQLALITNHYSALGIQPGASSTSSETFSRPYYWAPFILIGNGL